MNEQLTKQLKDLRFTTEASARKGYKTPMFRDALRPQVVLALLDVLDAYRHGVNSDFHGAVREENVLAQALEQVNV